MFRSKCFEILAHIFKGFWGTIYHWLFLYYCKKFIGRTFFVASMTINLKYLQVQSRFSCELPQESTMKEMLRLFLHLTYFSFIHYLCFYSLFRVFICYLFIVIWSILVWFNRWKSHWKLIKVNIFNLTEYYAAILTL